MPKTSRSRPSTRASKTSQGAIPPVPVERLNIDQSLRAMDRLVAAQRGRFSGGISPVAQTLALADWWLHLASAPGKQMELTVTAARKAARLLSTLMKTAADVEQTPIIEPLPGDHRFSDERWQQAPFNALVQTFLLHQQWWHNATNTVPGVSPHHEDMVSFGARQILDMFSPSNHPLTNPEVLAKTKETHGMNFVHGWQNWVEDVVRQISGQGPVGAENFNVGTDVALTPGKVIYRNELIELIQYSPATDTVYSEPILIVPAWIMKYYILDLSPHNSLIKHLIEQGHTVFCISWRNPGAEDRNLGFDDYRRLGVMAALDAVGAVLPKQRVHAVGYCLGGTLLSIAAASMACRGDERLATITLLAAQTDFTEPGELALFIDHSQMHYLASAMWARGYLSADQMAGAFQLLRSNDLVWSRRVREYLMGERTPMIDLMAWNADSTRLPYRMHAEYLQKLYLDNELASGRYLVDGRPAALQNIRVPIFVVGTERDHVAPWRSVYKIHYLSDSEITFVLTSSGHNAGIISEPGRPRRHYRMATRDKDGLCLSADEWARSAEAQSGSWWTAWFDWLAARSTQERVAPPAMGAGKAGYAPIEDAPGSYVLQR